jgi:hypothetical protein
MECEAVKLCECGCGNPTNRAKRARKSAGIEKGDFAKFLPAHHFKLEKYKRKNRPELIGSGNGMWKGELASAGAGRFRARKKYKLGKCENCGKEATDRHHRDGNPLNNDPPNVKILCRKCHMLADGRAPNEVIFKCGHGKVSENIYFYPSGILGCKACRREAVRRWRKKIREGANY